MRPDLLAFYQMMNQQNQQPQQGYGYPINSGSQMSPAMMDYYEGQSLQMPSEQEEQTQMAPAEEGYSPIQRGVEAGRGAAKRSLEMNDAQKDRAFGLALMQFGANLGNPGYGKGFGGTLNAINQSLTPAVEAYQKEEARNANINAFLQQEEVAQQKEKSNELYHQQQLEQKQRADEALERYRNAQIGQGERKISNQEALEEKKLAQGERHHLDNLAVKQKKLENKYGISDLNQAEEVPLGSLPKKFVNDWSATVNKEIQSIPINNVAIESIKEMKNIFEKYPDIGSSFLNLLDEEQKGGPSFLQTLVRNLPTTDKDKLSAVQYLKKLTADIQLDKIMGMPGQKGTDIMKRAVQAASPTGRLTYDTFNDVSKLWEKRANENIQRAKTNENALKRGVYIGSGSYNEQIPNNELYNEQIPMQNIQQNSENVNVQGPNGEIWTIPTQNLDQALARGAKRIE